MASTAVSQGGPPQAGHPLEPPPNATEARDGPEALAPLEQSLLAGRRLAQAVEAWAFQLGEPDLGDIDLPPVAGSELDQARLGAAASLYLVAELESARLLPAVETLAGLFASGGLVGELGDGTRRLVAFWHGRRERFAVGEREALFGRLFGKQYGPALAGGDGRAAGFESRMIDLTEALARVTADPVSGIAPADAVRLRVVATDLAGDLSRRAGGMASFAARELLDTITSALDILKIPEVQQAVGARSVWDAVRAVTRRYMGHEADVTSHVSRGRAGMAVLVWLGNAAPALGGSGEIPLPDVTVVAAAVQWMQATLALHERGARAGRGR